VEDRALSLEISIRVGELGIPRHLVVDQTKLRWMLLGGILAGALCLGLCYQVFSSARIYPQLLYQSRKSISDRTALDRLHQETEKEKAEVAAMDSIRQRLSGRFGHQDSAVASGPAPLSDERLLESLFPDSAGTEAWARSSEDLGEHASASRSDLERSSALARQCMARLERTPSVAPARGRYLSGFGWRLHPILGIYRMHEGQDISGPERTPVAATASGRVVEEEYSSSYGNYVVVAHGGGIATLYAHLYAFRCRKGESVRRGQIIGLLGNTGLSSGPHVHYEVHIDGKPVDPLPWILPTTLVP
jgi:murein DD-endopeptidase MepM/ murein hydrolase activator NlpD